jgi:butyrate kinase
MEGYRILAINPGSTSTKIAVYFNQKSRFLKTIRHPLKDLNKFKRIVDQYGFRKKIILEELEKGDAKVEDISAVVGRGGILKPVESGVYEVNEEMRKDMIECTYGEHASNLGGLIAYDIAGSFKNRKVRAFIADPTVVDEFQEVSRISGHPEFERRSIFHALNHKAMGRAYANFLDRRYEDLNLIIVHMGGGISVAAHQKGRVIDSNQALDGDGPFTPERSGTLPAGDLARLCFSGKYSLDYVMKMIKGKGGMIAYLGTNDAYEAGLKAESGDEKTTLILNAMAYQVAKEIGAMGAVLKGNVDAIILTGGIAHNSIIVDYIKTMIAHISKVVVYPGEDEMKALVMNVLMVMTGEAECKVY